MVVLLGQSIPFWVLPVVWVIAQNPEISNPEL